MAPGWKQLRGVLRYVLVLAVCGLAIAGALVPREQVHAMQPAGWTPPTAALSADGMASTPGAHGLGLVRHVRTGRVAVHLARDVVHALPQSVDLSQYAVPVGNQGMVGSCSSWAVAYGLRGWYANRDGSYPTSTGRSGFSPMFVYSQLTAGHDEGTDIVENMALLQTQGVDTRADYTQGDYDFRDMPTTSEMANARQYAVGSVSAVFSSPTLNTGTTLAQQAIESTLASGMPAVIGFDVWHNFDQASASNPFVGYPGTGADRGGHATIALKYDQNGVWIENSWGTGWGLNGWGELSWDYVNHYVTDVDTMTVQPTAQLISDPGFELGASSWTPSGDASISSADPRTGAAGLRLCGGNGCDGQAVQTVTLPTSFNQLAFTLWVHPLTSESSGCNDRLTVSIRSSDGATRYTAAVMACGQQAHWYQQTYDFTSDLQQYVGQKVQVMIAAATDAAKPTTFDVDDATFVAVAPGWVPMAPGKPTNLVVTPGNGTLKATWSAPASPGTAPIDRYDLVVTDPAHHSVGQQVADLSHLSAAFAGLTNGTAYALSVQAHNAVSDGPAIIIMATPDGPPSVKLSSTSATVQYSDQLSLSVSAADARHTPVHLGVVSGSAPNPCVPQTAGLAGSPLLCGGLPSGLSFGSVRLNPYTGAASASVTGHVVLPAGTYSITFTASDAMGTGSGVFTLTVTPEDASISASTIHPLSAVDSASAGTLSSLTVRGAVRDAADGSPGDIGRAGAMTFTLTPYSGSLGTPAVCAVSGRVIAAELDGTCTFPNLPVGVYIVTVSVGSAFYAGSGSTALAVYDPASNALAGAGRVLAGGSPGEVAFLAKSAGGALSGAMVYIQHRGTLAGAVTDVVETSTGLTGLTIAASRTSATLTGMSSVQGSPGYGFSLTAAATGTAGSVSLRTTDRASVPYPALSFTGAALTAGKVLIPAG